MAVSASAEFNADAFYVSGKVGYLAFTQTGFDSTYGMAIGGGWDFLTYDIPTGSVLGDLPVSAGVEAEYVRSLVKGDQMFGPSGEWEFSGFTGYGVVSAVVLDWLTARARLGLLLNGEVSGSQGGASWSSKDSGVAGGVGVVIALGGYGDVELDATGLAENMSLWSVGYRYSF